jgi:hypothetical protein
MPASYSGCQIIWAQDYGHRSFVKSHQIRFINGSAVEFLNFMPEQSTRPMICRYANGRAIEANADCPTFDAANTREKSVPAGCLEHV